jgi:hypothetical protein|tara:strand:+ start:509 stop:700 length:192 start_codon:yes stop_codon:yes gene_type:complete
MKKFYYIYEINKDWTEKFKHKAFSEHSAIQWIEEHLTQEKYKDSKFKIQSIYRGHSSYTSEEV